MNTPITLVTAVVLSATCTAIASDRLVWDNGDGGDFPYTVIFSSQVYEQSGIDTALADDFLLNQDTIITGVLWSGTGTAFTTGTPSAFLIEFYASDPSGPWPTSGLNDPSETALASYLIPAGSIAVAPEPAAPHLFLEHSADLPTAFVASKSVHYWISIQAYFPNNGSSFAWTLSTSQQLEVLVYSPTGSGSWESSDEFGDLVFRLYGTPVPAPGALAMLGVAASAYRRRRR